MKKLTLALFLGLLVFTSLHAQQTVVIERPGIFTDLASALVGVPANAVTGIAVGTVEAAGSLIHGSTQIVVAPPARAVPAPIIVAPAPVGSVSGRCHTDSGCCSDNYRCHDTQRRLCYDCNTASFGLRTRPSHSDAR